MSAESPIDHGRLSLGGEAFAPMHPADRVTDRGRFVLRVDAEIHLADDLGPQHDGEGWVGLPERQQSASDILLGLRRSYS